MMTTCLSLLRSAPLTSAAAATRLYHTQLLLGIREATIRCINTGLHAVARRRVLIALARECSREIGKLARCRTQCFGKLFSTSGPIG
jgi:hypothetical protein